MIKKGLSFIIPALNEERHIGGVLDSIRENSPKCFQYEVILVDNGSSDRTVEIARNKGAQCFHEPGCNISVLRNIGASKSTSDIFVFLDADVYLGEGWGDRISRVIDRLFRQPNLITGSFYGICDENNWVERVWFAPRTDLKETNYINSGHLIIHRSLFSRVGGFDPDLETGEDYEFCTRAKRVGARIENDPELKVVHAGYPKSIRGFFNKERWHARGDFRSLKTLASSKPALSCLANFCMASVCIIGAIFSSQPWFMFLSAYLLFLIIISLAASVHRNRGTPSSDFLGIVFLYMVYFTARTVSMIAVVIRSLTERKPALTRPTP